MSSSRHDEQGHYFCRHRGRVVGPYTLADMRDRIARGEIGTRSEVSGDGVEWQAAAEFPEFFRDGPSDDVWYIDVDGGQAGPLTYAELKRQAELGRLRPVDLVWREGDEEWQPARYVFGLFPPDRASPRSPGVAIAGFICAMLGSCIPFIAPVGLLLSVMALNRGPREYHGMAIAGVIVGGVVSVFWLAWLAVGLVVLLRTPM